MATYIQLEFQNVSPEEAGLLIAQLSEIGFEGFEEGEKGLEEERRIADESGWASAAPGHG